MPYHHRLHGPQFHELKREALLQPSPVTTRPHPQGHGALTTQRLRHTTEELTVVAADASASSLWSSMGTIEVPSETTLDRGRDGLAASKEGHHHPPLVVAEVSHSSIDTLDVLLGVGSFSCVYEVKVLCRGDAVDEKPAFDPHRTYAAKMLRRRAHPADGPSTKGASATDDKGDRRRLAHAAKDLAEEAALLSSLPRHDHIITLRGLSDGFFEDPSRGFLLLDRLDETLQDALERWRSKAKQPAATKGSKGSVVRSLFRILGSPSVARKETQRGLRVGLPLARAMNFLHCHRVIFRDISPSNIGFDNSGTLKLFDFGTARTVTGIEGRVMTCFTGTPRYMSPEAMVGDRYGYPSDVYSFAIVLWEVSTTFLRKPYAHIYDLGDAKRSIVAMQCRPPLHHVPNPHLQRLLKSGWNPHPHLRPTFSIVVAELERLRDGAGAAAVVAAA